MDDTSAFSCYRSPGPIYSVPGLRWFTSEFWHLGIKGPCCLLQVPDPLLYQLRRSQSTSSYSAPLTWPHLQSQCHLSVDLPQLCSLFPLKGGVKQSAVMHLFSKLLLESPLCISDPSGCLTPLPCILLASPAHSHLFLRMGLITSFVIQTSLSGVLLGLIGTCSLNR